MKTKPKAVDSLSLQVRLQVIGNEKISLGPGKVALLHLLAETGSIREAARRMDMSYMKAWSLMQTMKPLVATLRGGKQHGGVKLTAIGVKALALYQQMQKDSRAACEPAWKDLQRLLRPGK